MTGRTTTDPVDPPPSLSARAVMRAGLPAVHRDRRPDEPPPLIERWVGALERSLDPIVALLDNLPAHLDPELIPHDMLATVATWLGVPTADVTSDALRTMIHKAVPISRKRGTAGGLAFVLNIALPEVRLTVWESGSVTWSQDPDGTVPAPPPMVEIRHGDALTMQQRATIDTLARDQIPVNVPYRLVRR